MKNRRGLSTKTIIIIVWWTIGGSFLACTLIVLTLCIIKRRLKRRQNRYQSNTNTQKHIQSINWRTVVHNQDEQFTLEEEVKWKDDLGLSLPVDLDGKQKNYIYKDDSMKNINLNRASTKEFNEIGLISYDKESPSVKQKLELFEANANKSWKYNSPDKLLSKNS